MKTAKNVITPSYGHYSRSLGSRALLSSMWICKAQNGTAASHMFVRCVRASQPRPRQVELFPVERVRDIESS
jgi:hypothetical protein